MDSMKGQGMSVSILVITALAVLVLIVLGVFFTGGFRKTGTNMMTFVDDSVDEKGSANMIYCQNWCLTKAGMAEGSYPLLDTSVYCYTESGQCSGAKVNCTNYC